MSVPEHVEREFRRYRECGNAHLHFHCVVIDGVFDAAAAGGVIFSTATGLDAHAIATVQAGVRRRLLRLFACRGLLSRADAQAMAQWQHGGGFSVVGNLHPAAAPGHPSLRRLGQVKPCYAAPDRALWRWSYYPSGATARSLAP